MYMVILCVNWLLVHHDVLFQHEALYHTCFVMPEGNAKHGLNVLSS